MILGGGNALKRAHVGKLGVVDDDANCLSGIHGRAAAHGHDGISLGSLEGLNAILHVLDRGVGLNLGVQAPGNTRLVQKIGDLGGDAKLHQVGVGAHKNLLETAALNLAGDLLNGASAMIRNGVKNDSVRHEASLMQPAGPSPAVRGIPDQHIV